MCDKNLRYNCIAHVGANQDSRPEQVVNLDGMAVLAIARRKPTLKLVHPRREPVFISFPTRKVWILLVACAWWLLTPAQWSARPQEMMCWMEAIMEEIEEGSSARLTLQGSTSSTSGSHTIKDKEIGEWTLLDEGADTPGKNGHGCLRFEILLR